MKKISIIVDVLSNSLVNRITGDIFDTEILKIEKSDFKLLRKGWNFDWISEFKNHDIYKLVVKNNRLIMQGLIALQDKSDHILISLIESADFNIGKNKVYEGVAGNLFAFACKKAFDMGYNGYVAFYAKTNLIEHYINSLGARRIGVSQLMIIETDNSKKLIDKYFKE